MSDADWTNNTDGGLAIQQLVKLQQGGFIDMATFMKMTKDVMGSKKTNPVELDAAATSAAPAGFEEEEEVVEEDFDAESDVEMEEDAEDEEDSASEPATPVAAPAAGKQRVSSGCGSMDAFVTKHAAAPARIATERKVNFLKLSKKKPPPVGAKCSSKKQGGRVADVTKLTLSKRLKEHPNDCLMILDGQLFCAACGDNVGSAKQACDRHCNDCQKHKDNMAKRSMTDTNRAEIKQALAAFREEVAAEGGAVRGLQAKAEETQAARAEVLEQFLFAGIEVEKIDKLRPWLERRMGISLCRSDDLMATYIPPLKKKELTTLKAEFKGEFIGIYHDGTTDHGEAFCICFRACKAGFQFRICAIRVAFLESSMNANEISAELIAAVACHMQAAAHRPPFPRPPPGGVGGMLGARTINGSACVQWHAGTTVDRQRVQPRHRLGATR